VKKKVILFDFNNLAMRCFHALPVVERNDEGEVSGYNWRIWYWSMFNSIFLSMYKFRGAREVVLACDHKSWRKLVYPRYKLNREQGREESDVDWQLYYREFDNYLALLKANLPFKVLTVRSAEADDIIGVLALHGEDDYVVVSADKDYKQLLCRKNVKVYHPLTKKFMECPDTDAFIQEQCLTGQPKDFIPQLKPKLGPKTAAKIIEDGVDGWLEKNDGVLEPFEDSRGCRWHKETLKEQYEFNKVLLDFRCIPEVIRRRTFEQYEQYELPPFDRLYPFFKAMRWNQALDEFTRFENVLMNLYT
jgi:5'-3' exonuclease